MSIEASQGSFTPDSENENEFDLGFISGVYDSDPEYGLPYKEIRVDGQELANLVFDENGEYRLEYNIDTSDDANETVIVKCNLDPKIDKPDYTISIENNSGFWNNRLDTAIFSVDENALQSFIYNSPEYIVNASYIQSEDNGAELSEFIFNDTDEDNSFILSLGKNSYKLILKDGNSKLTLVDGQDNRTANLVMFNENGDTIFDDKHPMPDGSKFSDVAELFSNQNHAIVNEMVNDIFDTFGGDLGVGSNTKVDALVRCLQADFPEIDYEVVSNESQLGLSLRRLQEEIDRLQNKVNTYDARLSGQDEPEVDYTQLPGYEYFKDKVR